jgi:hypothetical protein
MPRWLGRAARAGLADPVEVPLKILDRLVEKREQGRAPYFYETDPSWEQRMHELIGAPWPCTAVSDFWDLWSEVLGELKAAGLSIGRGAYGGWGDGEPGMTRAAWCLTLHTKPRAVVETGVARGITSRFILEALDRNGDGHLWSIDLPPAVDTSLHEQIGAAVPERCRARWSYVRGSSRRRLAPLLAELGEIDLFVHDSRHTERNLRFELDHAWAALRRGGVILADDIDVNHGFHSFTETFVGQQAFACHAEPLEPDPHRQDEKGVFGLVIKDDDSRADA